MIEFYKGKRILLTDAAGTVGKELVRQLVALGPSAAMNSSSLRWHSSFLIRNMIAFAISSVTFGIRKGYTEHFIMLIS